MKLIWCLDCGDVRKVQRKKTSCQCGNVQAVYTDNLNVDWNGQGYLLGIDNMSLLEARRTHDKNSNKVRRGTRFEAFIIPDLADTVRKVELA